MPSHRPRRLFLLILALPVLFILCIYLTHSHRPITNLFSTSSAKLPDEIFGLLHFVTSPDESTRVVRAPGDPDTASDRDLTGELGVGDNDALRDTRHFDSGDSPALGHGDVAPDASQIIPLGGPVVPDQPVELAWYALGSITKAGERVRSRIGLAGELDGWSERLRVLREEYPLVVFSKSYCPYSKRAKQLLETYNLSPPPKIIEVDLRADASHIKTLLARLTHHSTFPNMILNGHSLGGSDDLIRLHKEGRLRLVLEQGGLKLGRSGVGRRRR